MEKDYQATNNVKLDLNLGKVHKKSKIRKEEMIWGMIFVAPLTIGLLMFLAAPLFYSLYISLTKYDLFNEPVFVGFNNFSKIFSSYGIEFWISIRNAFMYSIGVLLSMALSLIVANFLCSKIKWKGIYKAIFFIPTICSAVATTIMWKRMYDYQYGTLNQFISIFGFEHVNWLDEQHVVFAIIFMGVLFGFGSSMLLYISAIKSISRSYYEAADIDGANSLQKFFFITIPSISPITFYILVTGLIGSLQGFTVYQIMTNGSTTNTIMPVLLIYKYLGGDYGSFYGYASALAIVLGIIIAILTGLNFLLSRKWVYYES